MRILVLSDLHGRSPDPLLGMAGIDLVLILGDITTGAGLDKIRKSVDVIKETYPKTLAIPGNWERPESVLWLEQEGLSIDGKCLTVEGVKLCGTGGSIPTPFSTPREFSEEHYKKVLESFTLSGRDTPFFLVSHTPPFGVCDRTFTGLHVGSKSLREFIDLHQPDLVLCGHIHEARGKALLGKTIVVNPGPAPSNYAVVEVNTDISVELHG